MTRPQTFISVSTAVAGAVFVAHNSLDKELANINNVSGQSKQHPHQERLKKAIENTRAQIATKMYQSGAPGIVVAVSVNGKMLWKSGFGYSDIENRVLAHPGTVMRIASISKPLTVAAAARLWEAGKLDLDRPVREYVSEWPDSHPQITPRQLISHMAGIRHYKKKGESDDDGNGDKVKRGDGKFKEFLIKEKYETVTDALNIFKNDELLSKPGKEFNYTTHGYTLLSAVIEKASGEPFAKHMKKLFRDLGMVNTFLDEHETIIQNRSRPYVRNKNHELQNAPYVDLSCKWAGGGFLSTVQDLLKFGNAMLYSYQYSKKSLTEQDKSVRKVVKVPTEDKPVAPELRNKDKVYDIVYKPGPFAAVNQQQNSEGKSDQSLPGFLRPETMQELWTPIIRMSKDESSINDSMYGLGWQIRPKRREHAFCRDDGLSVCHTGGAVGTSSVLLVLPTDDDEHGDFLSPIDNQQSRPPRGVVVAILTNMEAVGLADLALKIAKEFEVIKPPGPHRVQKVYQC